MQLTSTLLKQYLGPEHAAQRAAIGESARVKMKERFRCEHSAAFQRSISELAHKGYPAWYLDSFFDSDVVA